MGQITDPRFRRVLLTGVGLTLALLIGASIGFVWLLGGLVGEQVSLPFIGEVGWINDVVGWGSAFVLAVLSTFLMIPVASAITSMFLDTVAQAVEDEHYPHLGTARKIPLTEALRDTASFLGVLIVANIFALVLYVIFAPAAPLIFWGLNGFLLGREYFTLAAMRRVGRARGQSPARAPYVQDLGGRVLDGGSAIGAAAEPHYPDTGCCNFYPSVSTGCRRRPHTVKPNPDL